MINPVLLYIFIGLLVYPCAMDMWYRICYKRCEFYSPDSINWYLGFFVSVIGWVVVIPFLSYKYLKEMTK